MHVVLRWTDLAMWMSQGTGNEPIDPGYSPPLSPAVVPVGQQRR
jgi:hypothetical protein